jgi:hypothetical protein
MINEICMEEIKKENEIEISIQDQVKNEKSNSKKNLLELETQIKYDKLHAEVDNNCNEYKSFAKRTFCQKILKFFEIFKLLIFCLILIISSLTNFSYLNFVYSVLGSLLLILIFLNRKKTIQTASIMFHCLFTLCILVIIFKIIFSIFFWLRAKVPMSIYSFLIDNKQILIDLGLKFMEEDEPVKWINSFISDGFIFSSYLLLRIYRFNYNNFNEAKIMSFLCLFNNFENLIFFFVIILLSSFNSLSISFLSFFYSTIFLISILLWSLDYYKKVLKSVYIILIAFSLIHFNFFHFLNIYSFRNGLVDSNLKIFNWLGILRMSYDISVNSI